MGIITPISLTESVSDGGTPKLDFRLGYCDLCMKCIEVCPTAALEPIKEEAVRLGVAEVDQQRCVAWTWRGCTKCQQVCPLEAIGLDDNQRPIVDASQCNGCGLCVYICPSTSLRSHTSASGRGIVVVPLDAGRPGES
jgi:ferredoxin-type protein NapG